MTVTSGGGPHSARLLATVVALMLSSVVGALPAQASTPDGHHHQGTAGTPSPSATAHTEHDADSHVDLPRGGQEWTTPDLVAQGALVQVETVAEVYVALHHYHVEKYRYRKVEDPQAVSSGTFVNSRGLVITGKGALADDAAQEKRFGTWGVNQAFVDAKFMKEMPADPFARTTITEKNKGTLADSPPTNPEINDRLQSCYAWETSHHCAVFVVMRHRVLPSVTEGENSELEGLPQSDARVAVLSTQPRGIAPLTLQLANPEPGAKYWVIASRGVNEEPAVGTGTLTDSERSPISAADLEKWSKEFGPLAEGAPVVSERGDLVAFLGTPEGSDELGSVSSSHMSNDLRTFGLARDSSPVDAQFHDGLELFEASQFAAAVPKLKAAAEATGGQRVAVDLLARAEERSGTAEDLSDEADVLTPTGDDVAGWSGRAIAVFSALVLAVLIAAMVALALTRRRHGAGGEEPAEDGAETVPPTSPPPGGGTRDRASASSSDQHPTTVFAAGTTDPQDPGEEPTVKRPAPPANPHAPAHPSGSFCPQCGSQLSPGDRFCFSCGTPAGRAGAGVSRG
ncbi:zinc ribbon domain-containing protein [Kineosporia succinea]|uniref:Zinc-ribbon domain-containing protein n=1 Tax=Kineosporia succinea TaxID=84632 RepID=A0ABT9P813_9ACTN|nr:zinc ribbon domain-containing protein [Kineosporia succinea]MDP9828691.1 hypothetical protein [Kineosporia succinea]